jgi:Spy/CpxP family protein refolding chaperone
MARGRMMRQGAVVRQGAIMRRQGAIMRRQGAMIGQGAAGMSGGPMAFGRGILAMRMARELGITNAQRSEIRSVLESHRADAQRLAAKGQPLRQQLHDAVMSNSAAAIDALAADLGALQAENAKLRAKVRGEVIARLTPEQQQKLQALEAQQQERMKQRRQQVVQQQERIEKRREQRLQSQR